MFFTKIYYCSLQKDTFGYSAGLSYFQTSPMYFLARP